MSAESSSLVGLSVISTSFEPFLAAFLILTPIVVWVSEMSLPMKRIKSEDDISSMVEGEAFLPNTSLSPLGFAEREAMFSVPRLSFANVFIMCISSFVIWSETRRAKASLP